MARVAVAKDITSKMDYVTSFENSLDSTEIIEMMRKHWTITVWISVAYVSLIFGGQRYMKSRPAYDLRITLGIWSAVLAIFSIAGAVRMTPLTYYYWVNHSFQDSVCSFDFFIEPPGAFWAIVFTVSKIIELLDTAFLVLRKKPVIFLHWYHHATVMVYCFYALGNQTASGRYFITLNFVIHSIMYSYYALKSFNVRIPKGVSMLITFLQLVQMAAGLFINYKCYEYLSSGAKCASSYNIIFWTYAMYASYLALFANFFYKSYFQPKHQRSKKIE